MKQVKRIMKPIFMCILAMSLSLTGIPHSAMVIQAKAESVKSGTISEDLIWQYDPDGTLTISGDGSMPDYTTENNYYTGITTDVPWGDYLSDISKVVISGNVNNIGKCAFSDCTSIKQVFFSSSVQEIGESAFARCTGLNSISFPNALVSIGDDAFRGCTGITNVIIPDSVTTIGSGAFQACTNLTDISLSKSISSIRSYTFCNCMKLTNIEIPQNITSIGIYAFSLCSAILELDIPISVNSISDEAFSNCSSLKKVTANNDFLYFGQRVFDNCASNFVLYGNNGSTSETYAEKNAHVFVIMNEGNSSLKDNKSRYKLINDSKTWKEAKTYCEQMGGHLATITSEDEQEIIEALLKNQGEKNCYWIGGYKENNQWKWINGEPFDFSNWDYGEPNGYHDDEYYIEIYGKEEKGYEFGKWNDMVNEGDNVSSSWHKLEYTGFICEWDNVSDADDKEETTITTIRKTPIKQYDSYNVVKYEDTDSGKIIKTAVSYNKAIEDYLSKINKQASNDIRGNNKQKKSVGKQLMEKDKDIHTLTYVASDEYAIAAYEMLAEYYDECTKTGIEIGKIKITDDYITISSNIIKK
ncbi:hypothetical protein D7V86_24685 [bacterium D16-51]|nr:hypothetical protein D7V96_25260 [bacterium D16-59]RKI53711.1 hypothetical protein D7V86_24685 [bacterium D16-51]